MPYTAPITGYIDNLGYLRCVDCAGDSLKDFTVTGDNSAFHGENCERCGWVFPRLTSCKDMVFSARGPLAPEYQKPQARLWAAE